MLWRCDPARVMASSFLRFLDHTQRRNTVDRTPLDEWSARRRDLYLTTHNTHNRQTSMPPVGFDPTISAGERPQTYALDRAATGTSDKYILYHTNSWAPQRKQYRCTSLNKLLLSATCLTSHSTHVTLLCLTLYMFLCTITVSVTRPIPCSLSSITQHIHLLRIHPPMVTIKITWCKMATWVALQVFIRTDHATDFSEFVWEVTVLPTANCLAKAAVTLKPEPTQHNSLDRLQIRK